MLSILEPTKTDTQATVRALLAKIRELEAQLRADQAKPRADDRRQLDRVADMD